MTRVRCIASLTTVVLVTALSSGPGLGSATWATASGDPGPVEEAGTLEATLFSRSLLWHGGAGADVYVELSRRGDVVGRGGGQVPSTGDATVWLDPPSGGGEPVMGTAVVRPDDRLLVSLGGLAVADVVVPPLAAEVGPGADRVLGRAPARSKISVSLEDTTHPEFAATVDVSADDTGTFEAFASSGVAFHAGHYGSALLRTPEGHSFRALFAVFEAEVTVGSMALRGRGTPGTSVEAFLEGSGAASRQTVGTVVTDGVDWIIPGPDGPQQSLTEPVAAGDRVTLTRSFALSPARRAISLVVPDLAVAVEESTDTVTGRGPVSTTLALLLTPPSGAGVRMSVRTDARGRFRSELAGQVDIAGGWTAAVVGTIEDGIRVRARDTVTQVRIWVHDDTVTGYAGPESAVRGSVLGPDGRRKGGGAATADNDGHYFIEVRGSPSSPDAVSIEPGDTVQVEFIAGDPIPFRVPELSAATDAAADVVSGVTIPGARVTVDVVEPSLSYTRTVTADDRGAYAVDYSGDLDIEPPVSGRVAVDGPGRLVLVAGWAPLSIDVSSPRGSGGYVGASGAQGRLVDLAVYGDDERQVFRATGRVRSFEREGVRQGFAADLVDEAGQPVAVRSGDRVRVVWGDDIATMVVPQLVALIDVPDNRIEGRTTPLAQVELRPYTGSKGATGTTVSDNAGFFSYYFGDQLTLTYGTWAWVAAEVGHQHTVRTTTQGPAIRFDLDQATVAGGVEPDLDIYVRLESAGVTKASRATTTDAEGAFATQLQGPDGEPAWPAPGDRLVISAPAARSATEMSLTVPELTLEPDAAHGMVRGRATPGGSLGIRATDMFPWPSLDGGTTAGLEPKVGGNGTFVGQFKPGIDLGPGWRFAAQYTLSSGHMASVTRYTPLVNVQHGGAHVCGYGPPGQVVDVAASDAGGSLVGAADGSVSRGGTYDVLLRDAAGRPVAAPGGAVVRVRIGPEQFDVNLPPLSVQAPFGPVVTQVTGLGPASTPLAFGAPVTDCFSWPARSGSSGHSQTGSTDVGGRFITQIDTPGPGEAFAIAFHTTDGQRFYRQITRPKVRVFVDTDRIAVAGTPFEQAAAALRGPDTTDLAAKQFVFDDDGRFDVHLRGPDGAAYAIRAGQTVLVTTPEGATTVTVEPLSFDFAAADRLVGQAPPDREVRIQFTLRDGRVLLPISRRADEQGRFMFARQELLPRSTWGFDDVASIEVVLPTADGHEMVAGADLRPAASAAAFLPLATRGQ